MPLSAAGTQGQGLEVAGTRMKKHPSPSNNDAPCRPTPLPWLEGLQEPLGGGGGGVTAHRIAPHKESLPASLGHSSRHTTNLGEEPFVPASTLRSSISFQLPGSGPASPSRRRGRDFSGDSTSRRHVTSRRHAAPRHTQRLACLFSQASQ